VHEIAGWVLLAFIILHVAGALKHAIIDKDETMSRMRWRR
jgi:cytochrome b561